MAAPPRADGLVLRGLSKRFGDVVAVDGLDLDVPRGALIGFLGPNGAGKTTTMRSILGMVRPDAGSITFDGQPTDDPERSSIGYMPQERGLYARMKALDQVAYFGRLAGLAPDDAHREAGRWLERVGLTDRADAMVQELSGGNQQRVQLAVSLVHDPDLLVLDEPFAGLDPVAADVMRDIIAERADRGASVLFSSHQLDLVSSLCEDVVIIAGGRRVAGGSISALRAASDRRRLTIRWAEPIAEWAPLSGSVTRRDPDLAVIELDAAADVGAHVAHAVAAAPLVEVAFEPPELDELFSDLVGGSVVEP